MIFVLHPGQQALCCLAIFPFKISFGVFGAFGLLVLPGFVHTLYSK